MEKSDFRIWLQEMWMRHKDELYELEQVLPDYDQDEYFKRLRWFLKREYKLTRGKK